jgi:serine/threonine protein kinase
MLARARTHQLPPKDSDLPGEGRAAVAAHEPRLPLSRTCSLSSLLICAHTHTPSQNLICRVNDELQAPRTSYVVLDLLGQGTFGQVFRCQDARTRKIVAVKVVKNKPAYRAQANIEIQVGASLAVCWRLGCARLQRF